MMRRSSALSKARLKDIFPLCPPQSAIPNEPPRICTLGLGFRSSYARVALPFCHFTLTAQKPTKPLPILNTLGDHIKRRRLELGLLQREVAERLRVKSDTVLNWEHSRTRPTLRYLPKVIAFLGYNPCQSSPTTLGEKVLQYRKSCGMSQKELARQIGLDPTTLSRIERNVGKSFPSILKRVTLFVTTHSSRDDSMRLTETCLS